jgi:hypothetical protein
VRIDGLKPIDTVTGEVVQAIEARSGAPV